MGVPVVATAVRGCREAVEHGRNGLLVPLGDVDALAEAVIEILNNEDQAQEMARQGRLVAEERFDQQIVFQRVSEAYARLLREHGIALPAPPATRSE